MTSQLVLGNGFGVGIASDSAVTWTTSTTQRTYNDAEKIFPLELPHRIAVLTSHAVALQGLPYDVLIRKWIRSIGNAPESQMASVSAYHDHFVTWLSTQQTSWSDQNQDKIDVLGRIDAEIVKLRNTIVPSLENNPDQDPEEVVLDLLKRINGDIGPHLLSLEDTTPELLETVLSELWSNDDEDTWTVSSILGRHLGDLPHSQAIADEVLLFIRLSLEKDFEFQNGGYTRLAFVGYGANDLLPSVSPLNIAGKWGDHLWRTPPLLETAQNEGSGFGLIYSQAQDDQIQLIFKGYDERLLRATGEAIADRYSVSEITEDPTEGSTLKETLTQELNRLSWDESLKPARTTIAVLPLTSLVDTAQSLVSFQAISKTLRGELPTVGGQIQSATITLDAGFKWRQRDNERYS